MNQPAVNIFLDEMPDLNFFKVGVGRKAPRLFASLEDSLGLKSVISFGFDSVDFIDILDTKEDEMLIILLSMDNGVMFAETGLCYFLPKQFEQLKEDYFVVKISGMIQ